MARTSKSRATGTVFSTTGALRMPGTTICSPALRKVVFSKSAFALRMASPSSLEVRNEVWDSMWRATEGIVSPRLARYKVLPGGTVGAASDELVIEGLGVAGTEPEVGTNLADCPDCAAAEGRCRKKIPTETNKAATVRMKLKRRTVNLPKMCNPRLIGQPFMS